MHTPLQKNKKNLLFLLILRYNELTNSETSFYHKKKCVSMASEPLFKIPCTMLKPSERLLYNLLSKNAEIVHENEI